MIASQPSRIVNLASVEHRIGFIRDIKKFMFDAKKFLYSETKLGNVLMTYEHQRQLGALGVQVGSCRWCCYTHLAGTLVPVVAHGCLFVCHTTQLRLLAVWESSEQHLGNIMHGISLVLYMRHSHLHLFPVV